MDAEVGESGRTVNPLAYAFGGSNPSPPTKELEKCGSNSVVESQPSKLLVAGSSPVSRSEKF